MENRKKTKAEYARRRAAFAKKARGQAAIEFMSYMSFFLVLFVISVVIFVEQQQTDVSAKRTEFASEIASRFAQRINFALYAGDGFSGNFTIPQTVLTMPYNVRVMSNRQVFVDWTDAGKSYGVSYPINTNSVSAGAGTTTGSAGTLSWVAINATMGEFKVNNVGGVLKLSQ